MVLSPRNIPTRQSPWRRCFPPARSSPRLRRAQHSGSTRHSAGSRRRDSENGSRPSEHVDGRGLSLALRDNPVLDPHALAGAESGQRAMSPAAKIPARARLQALVHQDPAVDRRGQRVRRDPCAAERRSRPPRGRRRASRRLSGSPFPSDDASGGFAQVEPHTVLARGAPGRTRRAPGRASRSIGRASGATTCTSMPRARRRSRDLETDEARAEHDRLLCALCALDDGPAVGERAQREDMGLVGARDGQRHRLRASGDEKTIEGEGFARPSASTWRPATRCARRACRAAGRCCSRRRTPGPSAGSTLPAPCRQNNPWKGSDGRKAARRWR